MALARWKDLCVDAEDPDLIGSFWAASLGLTGTRLDDGDWVLQGQRPGETVWVNRVPEPKTVKSRVHIDVRAELAEVLDAGATVLRAPDDEIRWHVLADPEGNELCVFEPQEDQPARFFELNVDTADAAAQAAWWADVLGADHGREDGRYHWVQNIGGAPFTYLIFCDVPERKTVKNRVHWDVVAAEVDSLVSRGATVLRKPDDELDWHVLADPEGNEFCVFAPEEVS